MIKRLAALSLLLMSSTALAQEKEKEAKKWDVAAPPMNMRQVPINVTEGTWMNLDVSPDGRTVAFDVLGDIYTMPIGGGRARRIAEGMPYEVQPRFSPDGRQIAFTSDRAGGDNIWIMNTDGSGKRQLTKESFTLLNNPTWSADGRYIAARKHFTTQRSAGTGEIWMYHVGGGAGVALVERPNPQHQKELGEPMFTPDGSGIYFSRDTTPGGTFQYAQNSNDQLFAIERYDLKTGERSTVASGPGGSVRPAPSPDGKYLAFVRRERAKSKLYIKDLRSGEERKVYDNLDQDLQETWAITRIVMFGQPGSARWGWMLNGHHLAANFTVVNGAVAFTPLFVGASPQVVRGGPYAGWQVLGHEMVRGFALARSLTDQQRRTAVVPGAASNEFFTGRGRQDQLKIMVGIPASQLSAQQQQLLWGLVREFVGSAADEAADAKLESIRRDGLERLHFAWWGSTEDPSRRFMYRIHGPSILIEYVRQGEGSQPANHVHAIVRDPRNDYAEDWLGKHYREQPHP